MTSLVSLVALALAALPVLSSAALVPAEVCTAYQAGFLDVYFGRNAPGQSCTRTP
jgi:hypothetical protein